jgi:hypothetical protein
MFLSPFLWRYTVVLTVGYFHKSSFFSSSQHIPKTNVIRIIVLDDNIQIYSYGLLCEHVLSMRTV